MAAKLRAANLDQIRGNDNPNFGRIISASPASFIESGPAGVFMIILTASKVGNKASYCGFARGWTFMGIRSFENFSSMRP
jgi:hypothetical protein